MERKELLYTGKAKKMYATDQENVLWAEYLNQATALNGVKKDTIEGKGRLNNQITGRIFDYPAHQSIPKHNKQKITKNKQSVKKVNI